MKLAVCPRCEAVWAEGIHVDGALVEWSGGSLRIDRRKSRILATLLKRRVVSVNRLVDEVYGDDPDGGPDDAVGALYSHVSHLRRELKRASFPMTIMADRHIGYTLVPALAA